MNHRVDLKASRVRAPTEASRELERTGIGRLLAGPARRAQYLHVTLHDMCPWSCCQRVALLHGMCSFCMAGLTTSTEAEAP